MSDELPAGRDLDAAVARAMGYQIYMANVAPNGWGLWDGVSDDPFIDDRERGYGKITLPRFSQPKNIADRAALVECIVWLAKRSPSGLGLFCNGSEWLAGPADFYEGDCVAATGDDMTAFALVVCRAIVKAMPA